MPHNLSTYKTNLLMMLKMSYYIIEAFLTDCGEKNIMKLAQNNSI